MSISRQHGYAHLRLGMHCEWAALAKIEGALLPNILSSLWK